MTRRDLTELLEEALVEWATEQRDVRGDIFATAQDLENIKSDPLGFADLLPRDALEFVRRMLRIQHEREDAVAIAELARWHHAQVFQTSDGYRLRFDGRAWTDGDLEFATEPSGWPVDADGNILHGHFVITTGKE